VPPGEKNTNGDLSRQDFLQDKTCWAVTTGEAGMISQVEGLAEAVGIPYVLKTIQLRTPWRWLPGHLCFGILHRLTPDSDTIAPPWPDLLITCGRRTTAMSIAVRKLSQGKTFTVHTQNPQTPLSYFDLVAPPKHDGLTGPNVVSTRGAIHRITPQKLSEQAEKFAPAFAHLPRPLVAVLIGGSNRSYRLTPTLTNQIADRLALLTRTTGAGLAITPSRRTGAENTAILKEKLTGESIYLWGGGSDNPYLGLLGLADYIVVTCDSVSMVSEACSTGKPVYVIELEGKNKRFRRFHQNLEDDGVTRPFLGQLEHWSYSPINDTKEIAEIIYEKIKTKLNP
jgi:uncharacterized protein